MISCPLCTKACQSQSALTNHMVTHTKEKPHKCDICSAAFGTVYDLKKHIKRVHYGIKQIRNKNSHCPLCNYKCDSKTVLKAHLRKHSADRPFSCKIPNCRFKTKYENCLQQHIRAVHNNDRLYECPSVGCNFKANSNGNLKQHLTTHSIEKPFACNVPGCNYTCKWKPYLAAHASRAHSDQKPFKCSKCDYRGKHRRDVTMHERTHVKKEHFQCQHQNCAYQTQSLHRYRLHRKTHNKEEKRMHVCTFCSSRFSELNQLQGHIKRHTTEKPYRCSHCEYTAVSITELRRHARSIHNIYVVPRGEEDEVSKCRTCNVNFLNNSELVLHSMDHLKPVVVLEQLKLQFM